MTKMRLVGFFGLLAVLSALTTIRPLPVLADSCPADQHDGVRVQGCQVGDDIQVLVHNYNTYDVSVDVNLTYREKSGALRSKSFFGRVSAGGGGQIGLIEVRPYYTLNEVTDITLKDVTKR